MSNKILRLLNILLIVFAVLGTNIIDLFSLKIGPVEKIVASIVLVIIYLVIERRKDVENFYSLQKGSRKFDEFFERWYSQDGTLRIFCDDLDWLKNSKTVIDALRDKGKKLHLYLKNSGEDEIAKQLKKTDAHIYRVKGGIVLRTSHRLSVLEDENMQKIIIRDSDKQSKDPGKEIRQFIETDNARDPYIISLTLDMLRDSFEEEK